MGEETTLFDFLIPQAERLRELAAHYLGREKPEQGAYFRWQMFDESNFTLAHVYGALLVFAFLVIGAIAFRRALAGGGDQALVPPARFNLRNLIELFTAAVLGVAEG